MGVAQIMLDDLDLSNIVIGWYKLFGTSSLVSLPQNRSQQQGPNNFSNSSGASETGAAETGGGENGEKAGSVVNQE